jgi:pimeloyl-ACP methyl ester carboxylesterase
MHYLEAGDPGGPPVLLVHGWPQHFWEWREVIPTLADAGYRVIAPDLRGLGWSDAPRDGYGKEAMARDLLSFLDTLGIEETFLAGHDWGGYIGYLLALLHPERVRAYLACNIIHPWLSANPPTLSRLPRTFYQWIVSTPGLNRAVLARREVIRSFFRTGSGRPEAWSDQDVEIFAERFRHADRVRASAGIYGNFLFREFLPLISGRYDGRRLTVPTLALFGTGDFVMNEAMMEGYESHADDMRLELVPGAGHFIVEEQPRLVADRCLSHFGAPVSAADPRL